MLQNPLSRQDAEHIAGTLNAAKEIVSSAGRLYEAGLVEEAMVGSLMDVQGEIGRYLAFFTDGQGYGWARPDAISEMLDVEYEACALLFKISRDAFDAEKQISS